MNKEKKINSVALALSGGGGRGAIHLGVLQAFEEHQIKIEAVSGTSIGAIIGGLFCAGINASDIKDMFNGKMFRKIFKFSWSDKGLLNMDNLLKLLQEYIPENDFKSLKIPFHCCVSDLHNEKFKIFSDGDLYKSIAASASIPIVFEPVQIDGGFYFDGGMFNNVPVDPLLNRNHTVVGVYVNNYKYEEKINLKSLAERVFSMTIRQNAKPSLEKCDYVIAPYININIGVLNFDHGDFLFDLGYREAVHFIQDSF